MSDTDPPWPLNEIARINRLRGYRVLDTPPDPAFDRLTQLAARFFGVPIALVSFVDEGRQWFKARHGLDSVETSRRQAFCAHAILDDRVMVVPDTALDARFAGNALVTGAPFIRFYAGAPLKAPDGLLLGTFCVIDQVPRDDFGAQACGDLEEFARIVMHELEMRSARLATEAARQAEAAARAAAQQAEVRYRAVVETAVDAMVVIDQRGVMQSFNAAAERIFGYAAAEAVGRNVTLLMPEPDHSRHAQYMDRYLTTGERRIIGIGREVEGRRKDGSTFPLELSIAEWRVGDQRYFTGIMRDVSRRKQAERALRASEERFRLLIEHAPQHMWVDRPNGVLEFFNAAWRDYTGHATEDATRWTVVHPDDRERVQEVRDRALAAGEPYDFDMRVRRADGVYRWHLCRINPMREDGTIVGWVGMASDVDDIRRARESAEAADRSKSRFLAAASHDLRQPMQSLLLFAEAMLPHLSDGDGRVLFGHLQSGLETLKSLLDSLLDVSRLDAGIVSPQIETFPITEITDQLRAAYAPVAEAKGLGWDVAPCPHGVRSDRVLLGRMLRNLVDNAIRYTRKGRIVIDCAPRGDTLHIEVRDTGIGIPLDQQQRIFEEFHQVGNPERDRDQGLGLGLAIVRRLSRLLDHPVSVASNPGRGSVFGLDVPLVPATEREMAREAARAASPAGPAPGRRDGDGRDGGGGGRFAVVVDDEAVVLLGLRTMLEGWGYEVLIAASTDQAMERLRAAARKPDIVLVDYRLREGRVGTETVVRIRESYGSDVPGIIVTGEIGPEPQNDASAHDLALLHKPVTPRMLEAALARRLEGARRAV